MREFSPYSQTFIYDLVSALQNNGGIENEIVYYGKRIVNSERPFGALSSAKQLELDCLGNIERLILKVRKKNKKTVALYKYINKTEVSVVHCHFLWCIWQLLDSADFYSSCNIPILVSAHGTDVTRDSKNEKYRDAILNFSKNENVFFSGTTPFLKKLLSELGVPEEKIFIIPNSVNPMFLVGGQLSIGASHVSDECFRIACVARFVGCKGHRYLISAFSRFVDTVNSNSVLTLVGDGEQLLEMKQLAIKLGIKDKVEFVGVLSHERVVDMLRKQDVYVQPSIHDNDTGQVETFGVAVLEAIAMRVPVIVSAVGGLPYVIGQPGPYSQMVGPGDVDDLYRALVSAHSLNSREGIDEYSAGRVFEYSQSRQVQRCIEVYDEIVQGGW